MRYNRFMIDHERDTNSNRFPEASFQTTQQGLALMTKALATVADHLGSREAGQSFRQTFVPRKKTKAHDYLLWGSPYSTPAWSQGMALLMGGTGGGWRVWQEEGTKVLAAGLPAGGHAHHHCIRMPTLSAICELWQGHQPGWLYMHQLRRNRESDIIPLPTPPPIPSLCSAPGAWVLLHASHTLGQPQLRAYVALLMAVNLLWSKSFTRQRLMITIHVVLVALAKVENHLPACELDMKLHNLGHLLRRIFVAGPLWVTSLFAAEDNWGDCMQWATNRAHPEVSMGRSAVVLQTVLLAHAANPEAASSRVVKPMDRWAHSEWWLP